MHLPVSQLVCHPYWDQQAPSQRVSRAVEPHPREAREQWLSAVHRWAFFGGTFIASKGNAWFLPRDLSDGQYYIQGNGLLSLRRGLLYTGSLQSQFHWSIRPSMGRGPTRLSLSQHYRHSLTPPFRTMFHSFPTKEHCIETDRHGSASFNFF